jgi:hypothetical protein
LVIVSGPRRNLSYAIPWERTAGPELPLDSRWLAFITRVRHAREPVLTPGWALAVKRACADHRPARIEIAESGQELLVAAMTDYQRSRFTALAPGTAVASLASALARPALLALRHLPAGHPSTPQSAEASIRGDRLQLVSAVGGDPVVCARVARETRRDERGRLFAMAVAVAR